MHLSADLSEFLFVDSRDRQRRLILLNASLRRQPLSFCFNAFRQRKFNRMRIAEREDDLTALHIRFVTNPDDVHLFREALHHAQDRVVRQSDEQTALHGLARALANNAILGVVQGFSKQMDVVGVGYKADVQGRKVVFALGYSHPIEFPLPEGIEAKAERLTTKGSIQQYQTTLTISGIDKQKLGQVCAEMHKLRKPDAYKGKGVRYADVPIKLKPGKTGK